MEGEFMKLKLFSGLSLAIFLFFGFKVSLVGATPFSFNQNAVGQATSLNWAGYVAQAGKFTSVQGTWIVPKVGKSKKVKTDAAWVGIGGVDSNDLIQAGTMAITGMGATRYSVWYELLPNYSKVLPLPVKAGDSISASIQQIASTKWKIYLVNNSSGQSYTKVVSYKSLVSSAEWVEEMPSDGSYDLMPLDNFKTVTFSNGFVIKDGKKASILESGAKSVQMVDKNGKALAVPTILNPQGSGFNVDRTSKLSGTLLRKQ
ncbi:MAG: hypothetical protein JWO40_314 [Candidatus Doudnabacteria bacterium]|nr:hypothetical protein [Candidatus Doudnabacteria bacterium]